MSRYCGNDDSKPILEAVEHWRQNGLINDGSIFSGKFLWKLEHFKALDKYFINQLDEGDGTFFEKLAGQLAPTDPEVKQLTAEILWVMLLCPSNISSKTKADGIRTIWNWSGESLPEDLPLLHDAILGGVGSSGTAYNTNRWRELIFVIRVMMAFKELTQSERESFLKDGWAFAKWMEQIPECDTRQFRHMILFLLFPDDFERIFGGTDRRKIVFTFGGKSDAQVKTLTALDIDKELSTIRKNQAQIYETKELDFYVPPLRELWRDTKNVSWLITWNPKMWNWETMANDRSATHANKTVTLRWTFANRNAKVGDKAYLSRTGVAPKGIIAVGNIVTAPFEAPHWDETKSAAGENRWYVEIDFTRIQDPLANDSYLTIDDLNKITIDQQIWNPQSSGIEIKPRSAGILNKLWEKIVESAIKPGTGKKPIEISEATNLIYYGPPGHWKNL